MPIEPEPRESTRARVARPRISKLLRVLVAGGALIAVACATAPRGSVASGSAGDDPPDGGGGTQGW